MFFLALDTSGASTAELFKTMQSRSGLIELLYFHGDEDSVHTLEQRPPASPGFFHIGLTTPSVEDILERTRAFYKRTQPGREENTFILKPLGPPTSMLQMGLSESTPAFHASTNFIFSKIAFIADPDNNWIELVPKGMHK